MVLAAMALTLTPALAAHAQVGVVYDEALLSAATYLNIEYGHFDEYVEWLKSTWKPLNETKKKAGLIFDYKMYFKRFSKPEVPNVIFMLTYQNMAALDRRAEKDAVAIEMIGSAAEQIKLRIHRSVYRKNLDTELI